MSRTAIRAIVAMVPLLMLAIGAGVSHSRRRSSGTTLQVIGVTCLAIVLVAHLFEGLHVFTFMGWGKEGSAGHYLDLLSALCGATLFPLGYLMDALKRPV